MKHEFDFSDHFRAANEAMKDIMAEAIADFERMYPREFRIRTGVKLHIEGGPAREFAALKLANPA